MKRIWNTLSPVLLWASLWGLTEATLGYALHLLPVRIGWAVWFPLAYFFMRRAGKQTDQRITVLYVAAISACIKLIDLFLPGRIDRVINPAVSILLEGIALYAVCAAVHRFPNLEKHRLASVFGVNTLWRLLYAVYIAFMPKWMVEISPVRGMGPFAEFLLLQNAVTSAVICLFIRYGERISGKAKEIYGYIRERVKLPCKLPQPAVVILLALFNLLVQIVL